MFKELNAIQFKYGVVAHKTRMPKELRSILAPESSHSQLDVLSLIGGDRNSPYAAGYCKLLFAKHWRIKAIHSLY